MNQNDQSSKSQLSLEPLNEGSPIQQPSAALRSGSKTVCPKCGYRAKSADDPLLTKHEGLGECPKCGIIVQKYLEKYAKTAVTQTPLYARSSLAGDKHREPVPREVILSVIFIALIGLMLLFKLSGPQNATDGKPVTETVQASAVAHPPQQAAATRPHDPGMEALAKLQAHHRDKLRAQFNIESSISVAETAAAEIGSAKYSQTDPKIIAAYGRCQDGFLEFAWMLRRKKDTKERIKSIDDQIASVGKRSAEKAAALSNEINDLSNQEELPQGFTNVLLYNVGVDASAKAYLEINRLQDERNKLIREDAKGGSPGSSLSETCGPYP